MLIHNPSKNVVKFSTSASGDLALPEILSADVEMSVVDSDVAFH